MNIHESNARRIADAGGPMGALCRGLLKLLDDARADSIWCQAVIEYQDELRTLGGIPRHFPKHPDGADTWDNAALPVEIHSDYRGVL